MQRQHRIQKAPGICIKYHVPLHLGEKGIGYTNAAAELVIRFTGGNKTAW